VSIIKETSSFVRIVKETYSCRALFEKKNSCVVSLVQEEPYIHWALFQYARGLFCRKSPTCIGLCDNTHENFCAGTALHKQGSFTIL